MTNAPSNRSSYPFARQPFGARQGSRDGLNFGALDPMHFESRINSLHGTAKGIARMPSRTGVPSRGASSGSETFRFKTAHANRWRELMVRPASARPTQAGILRASPQAALAPM